MASGGIEVRVVGTTDFRQWQRAEREFAKMRRSADTLQNRIRNVGESMTRAGQKMRSVGSSMTRYITAPVVAIGAASIKSAADFETSFAKIEGLVGVAGSEIDELQAAARELGPAYGTSANEAAEALFFITSAGLRGSDAIETLESSLKASAIGLGETAVVADLATSALNAYGADVLSASEATDVLTNAVRLGKLAPDQLSAAMGQILPVASAMGVEFHEVGAAFAAMSRTGTDANVAATQLRQILATILSPSNESATAIESVGLSVQGLREQIRDEGLLSVLQTLVDRFDGNSAATAEVFGNIRALSGVLDLMGSNVAATTEIFDGMTNSLGTTDEAFAVTADTANFGFKVALEELRLAMMDLGETLMPIATDIAESIRGMVDRFRELSPEQQDFLTKAALIAAAAGPLIVIMGNLAIAVGVLTAAVAKFGVAAVIATGGLALLAGLAGYAAFKTATMTDAERAAIKAAQDHEAANYRAANGYIELRRQAEGASAAISDSSWEMRRATNAAAAFNRHETERFQRMAEGQRETRAMAAAEAALAAATEDAADAVGGAGGPSLTDALVVLSDEMREALQRINDLYVGTSEAGDELAQYARDVLAAGTATEETKREIERLAGAMKQELSAALSDAEGRLTRAQQAFDQYRDSIAGGIRSGNTIADAVSDQTKATEDLAEAERAYSAAQDEGDPDKIAEAAENLARAKDAQGTFTDFLARGAETAQVFAGQIDQLRLAGASLSVTQEIAELGAETGGRIIAELLAGGAEAIQRANELTAAVEAASMDAANAAAKQFYGAGVRAAQAMVDGLKSQIDELDDVLEEIVERIADAFERQKKPSGPSVDTSADGPSPAAMAPLTQRQVDAIYQTDWGALSRQLGGLGGIPAMADGGLVLGPTLALIGEAGPELVLPLDRAGGMGGDTINVTVTSADPQAVVEAIRRYTRSNGPLGSSVVL